MSHRYGRGDVMARDSRQIADLLAPVNGIRGEQQRRGEKPRDFMRENRRDLAERQKENRAVLRQEEELQAQRREVCREAGSSSDLIFSLCFLRR